MFDAWAQIKPLKPALPYPAHPLLLQLLSSNEISPLFQLLVLRFVLQDGDVWVGVFRESEEALVALFMSPDRA